MADDLLFWCDVRKNINAAQLVIGLNTLLAGGDSKGANGCISDKTIGTVRTELRLLKGCVLIRCKHDAREQNKEAHRIITFNDLKLKPDSCNGLKMSLGEELHMRLQMTSDNGTDVMDRETLMVKEERNSLQAVTLNLTCRTCENPILSTVRFSRVLDLPSESWEQLSKDLCCHGTSLPEAYTSLNPSQDDCLLGSYYIVVHPSSLEAKNIIITQSETTIHCGRCRKSLGNLIIQQQYPGQADVSGIQLNKHCIISRNSDVFRNYSFETYITRCLKSKLQGKVNFKFCLQSHHGGKTKTHALLWLMNSDAVIVSNLTPGINTYGFHPKEEKRKNGKNSKSENEASLTNVMKILYKALPKNMSKAGTVETLSLPEQDCLQLLLLLAKSTLSIPPSLRHITGYTVGFLRT
ncbi:E3 ubiquitin-protein ligase E3D isoform X2 [Nematostella vectensis]|uniref:E3 ubiquitin-protein ligase E3D isoform X2 n=1 Tax=Nematostella vectensis TaxID=45351 RepID=UPI0020770736|nr:E3 ubiquitin-protein ligase E3D isoform X2 [Nematostella vectensis]